MLTMREHIEILTAENSALRGLDARSNSRPAQGREQLQSGDFKFTDEQVASEPPIIDKRFPGNT